MSNITKEVLLDIVGNFSYYLIHEAQTKTRNDVTTIEIDDISYRRAFGRFGDVFVIDIFYHSEYGKHKSKVAIKFAQDKSQLITEIKNTALLEQKFSTRSIIQVPRYIFVNLLDSSYVAYEGITGETYEDIEKAIDKSFWAGYVLAIIHGTNPRPVICDIYEEIFRRLAFSIFSKDEEKQKEETIMVNSKKFFEMMHASQGGCDAFGDFHQSNLMLRVTPQGDIVKIALIDPTFWMSGSFDRFEDMGTFFGRQAFLEYRATGAITETLGDVREFLNGYSVHLREMKMPKLRELYPKGFTLDLFLAIWAMMDLVDKTTEQNIPITHPDIQLLKEFAYYCLTEQPIDKNFNR